MTSGKGKAKRGSRTPPPAADIRQALRDLPETAFESRRAFGELAALHEEHDDAGGELAGLVAYDLDPEIVARARALVFAASHVPEELAALGEAIRSAALPVLERAMRDAKLPDRRKCDMIALHSVCGGTLDPDELPALFKDHEAVMGQLRREITGSLSPHPESVEQALAGSGLIDGQEGGRPFNEDSFGALFALATGTGQTSPEAASAMICSAAAIARERDVCTESTLEALDWAAATMCGRAAWGLAELASWPAMGAIGERAAALGGGLASGGVTATCPVLVDYSHGFVSAVDGMGSRSIHLLFRTPEGGLDGMVLISNDLLGLRDAWCAFGAGNELMEHVEEEGGRIPRAPCTLEFAREILGDAFALHARLGKPPLGRLMIYRPYLGRESVPVRQRKPNLGAYMTELMDRTPALVKDSDELIGHPSFGLLDFASDEAYEFLARNKGRRPSRKVLAAFAQEVAPLGRDILLSRMAANLEIESLAGRATAPDNRLAARTWLGLTENVVPFHEAPYVRELCRQTAGMVLGNLRLGFRNQAEANQAAIEMDAEDADEEDNDMGFPF